MNEDISALLSQWRFDDEAELQVRRITGADGSFWIQMRIDLGILQMEPEGRPDGARPHGCDTLLEYFVEQAEQHRRSYGWYEDFELDASECAALRREALQFYHRRRAFMALQEYAAAVADADHNLEMMDFISAFAADPDDAEAIEQYRSSVMCHRIQSVAMYHLANEDPRAACDEVEAGIRTLEQIFEQQDRSEVFPDSAELAVLDDLRRDLLTHCQVGDRQRLQMMLDRALRREDPDEAADLRGRLRDLDSDG